ncbi:MAG: class I SAM-dependent methyltransferase [Bacillota bacterium]|nr:class I SAM-dependent methyltransferase [Bacillota bacterium]
MSAHPYRGSLGPVVGPIQPRLDVEGLRCLPERPPLWTQGEPMLWDDPHISQQMLRAHLDPETDAASRKPATIDRSVEWIASTLGLRAGQPVIDLGCGPGLYAARLARRGLRVTGVDYSRSSIAYARGQAQADGLDIEYVCRDYRTIRYAGEFDAALLVYYDLGVLPPADCDAVLANIHRALRPGGRFVVDVLTGEGMARSHAEPGWYASSGGFWRPGPHLVSTRVVVYPEVAVALDEYLVVEQSGEWTVYRLWTQGYTLETLGVVLARHGFEIEGIWSDLLGNPYSPGCEALGVIARKA